MAAISIRPGLVFHSGSVMGSVVSFNRNGFRLQWLRVFTHTLFLPLTLLATLVCAPAGAQTSAAEFGGAVVSLGAGFNQPTGVAVDRNGNIYVVDYGNSAVKKISAGCTDESCVTTLGGGFNSPTNLALDSSGNLYVADAHNNAVKKMTVDCASLSCVTTLGGGFNRPFSVALDGSGNLYVTDYANNAVKKMPVACTDVSCVTTLPFTFTKPYGVAVDNSDNIYLTEQENSTVNKIPAGCNNQGCVTTLGGGFNAPYAVTVDGGGNVYVAVRGRQAVVKIPSSCTSASCVTPLVRGFTRPTGIALDRSGNVYVADAITTVVQEIMLDGIDLHSVPVGTTSTESSLYFSFTGPVAIGAPKALTLGTPGLDFAVQSGGTCTNGNSFINGDTCSVKVVFSPSVTGTRKGAVELTDNAGNVIAAALVYGTGTAPQLVFNPGATSSFGNGFNGPSGVAVDGQGNVYVADTFNNAVKKMPPGCADATCLTALGAGFSTPGGVTVDGSGVIYVADRGNNAVKKMPPGCTNATCVTTLGGGFFNPIGVTVDGNGAIYVADMLNNAVKKVLPGCADAACVTALGGGFNSPNGVAVDGQGNIYVADTLNDTIKKMPSSCAGPSCVTTLGGGFTAPTGIALDGSGNLYVTESGSNVVKEMPVGCNDPGCVTDLGSGFDRPNGLTVDGQGNIYIADTTNNAVKEIDRVTPPGLRFASTAVGASSIGEIVKVANIGNEPLTVSGAPSTSVSFAMDDALNTCSDGTVVAAGADCTLAVKFQPTQAGTASGSLVLTDNNLNATAAPGNTQTIGLSGTATKADTSATVSSSENPSGVGDTVTFTATVTNISGNNAAPTGEVQFIVDGVNSGSPVPLTVGSNGVSTAELPLSNLAQGSRTIAANYTNSDGNFNGSSGTLNGPQSVRYKPTITIPPSASAISYGQKLSDSTLSGGTAAYNNNPVAGTFAWTTPATAPAVGLQTESVTFTPTDTTNYFAVTGATTLSVSKATLMVTANNAVKVYGTANPAFTGTVTGAVNGDTFIENYTTAATQASNVGSYPVMPSVTGANLSSYTVSAADGTLTVTQAASSLALTASSTTLTPDQQLTLTATAADITPTSVGVPTGIVSFYNGTILLGTSALSDGIANLPLPASKLPGETASSLTAAYAGDMNFIASSSTPVVVTVSSPDFTLTPSSTNLTVAFGGTVSTSFTIVPLHGAYSDPVNFSTSGLPTGATATFSPATIPADSSTVQTVRLDIRVPESSRNQNGISRRSVMPIALGLLLIPFTTVIKLRRPLTGRMVLLLAVCFVGIGALAGCGGGGSSNGNNGNSGDGGHDERNYIVTVTATSGSISNHFNLDLNVK